VGAGAAVVLRREEAKVTDRIHALTLILDDPVRDDDVKHLIAACRMLRGVIRVERHIATSETYTAEARARQKLLDDILHYVTEGRWPKS